MSALFADNFGWYTTAQLSRIYTVTAAGTISVGAVGRNSGPGCRMAGSASNRLAIPLSTSGATGIVEVDRRVSAYPASSALLAAFTEGGSIQVGLYLNSDGTISAYRGDGTDLVELDTSTYELPLDTWVRIGFLLTIDGSSGVVTVTAQGPGDDEPESVLALTSQDTLETASATWDGLTLGPGSAGHSDICNLVVKDGSGSVNDDLAGVPQNVVDRHPNGNGAHSDFTRSSGLDQYAGIDDPVTDDDVSYNDGDAVDDLDTVEMQDLVDADHDIDFLMLGLVARNGGGSEALAHVLRQGSTDTASAGVVLTATYDALLRPYDTLPDTTAWTPAGWNAVQCGYKRTA